MTPFIERLNKISETEEGYCRSIMDAYGSQPKGQLHKDLARVVDLYQAFEYALAVLSKQEPEDSRAVSDEFVAMALALTGHQNEEGREILKKALDSSYV